MKNLFLSLSLLAALAAFAGESTIEATAQVYGVLTVSSTASKVIVSVPWVAASNSGSSTISVAEIIRPTNLTDGDWIRAWNGTQFNVWQLQSGTWVAGNVVSSAGLSQSGSSDETMLKRGDAIILYRQNAASQPVFYVQGQYAALTASDTTTVSAGSSETPAYTLLAPPKTMSVDLNSDVTWSGTINEDDLLVYGESSTMGKALQPLNNTYTGNVLKWGQMKGKTFDGSSAVIPAGIGLWYVSRGGSPTIQWAK